MKMVGKIKPKVKTLGKIKIVYNDNPKELEFETNKVLEELKEHFIQKVEINESGNRIFIHYRYVVKTLGEK
jgi:hypothetical protein